MARTVVVVVAMAVLGCGAGDSRGRQRPTAAPLAPAPPAAPAADDEPAAGEPTAVELEQARRELAAMAPLSQVVIRTKLVSRGPDVGPPNVPPPDAPFALV